MMPFEWGVDTRASQKDAIYGELQGPIHQSALVRDRQLVCGQVYVDPAVPVPRPQKNFVDTVPGAPAVRDGPPPPSREVAGGGSRPSNPIDHNVATNGILEAPAPFTAYIGSH